VPYDSRFPTQQGPLTQTEFNNYNSLIESLLNGFTPAGTFVSPYDLVIAKNTVSGTDYFWGLNGYAPLIGGEDDVGGIDGTDFTAVFNAALALGGDIKLVQDTYIYDDTLYVNIDNTHVYGGGSTLQLAASVGATANLGLGLNADNLLFRDIYMDGNGRNQGAVYGERAGGPIHCAVTFGAATKNVHIDHCSFYDYTSNPLWSTIVDQVSGPQYGHYDHYNTQVTNCIFDSIPYCDVIESTKGYTFTGNSITNILGEDLTVTNSGGLHTCALSLNYGSLSDIFINNNYFDGSDTTKAYAGINHGGSIQLDNIVIADNTFKNFSTYAIRNGCATVTGNQITACGGGLDGGFDESTITGNVIKDMLSGAVCILILGSNTIVDSNIIEANSGIGIQLSADNNQVTGNCVKGTGTKGIYLNNVSGCNAAHNKVTGTFTDGIYLSEDDTTLIGNIVSNSTTGIYYESFANSAHTMLRTILIGNNLHGNATPLNTNSQADASNIDEHNITT